MQTDIYSIDVIDIKGQSKDLSQFKGQVMLIVNVASKCGLTKQYKALQELYENYKKLGFVILGFPSNDFRGQEPGSNEEILEFCSLRYNVTFPMFAKTVVCGNHQHPLFRMMTSAVPQSLKNESSGFEARLAEMGHHKAAPHDILWNFEKFLVSRTGNLIGRFAPDMSPDDPALVAAVEKALGC